jgi:hypothetical protein
MLEMVAADHYLPAALIGGFGARDPRQPKSGRRYFNVAIRNAGSPPDEIKIRSAHKVASVVGLYRMKNPPEGLSENFIDDFWDTYESELPWAVERFERDEWTSRDWETVYFHMVAAAVRHPDFERVASQYRTERGEVVAHPDDVQRERLLTLQNTTALLAEGRCAVLRTPEDAQRLVLNDKGFATIGDPYNGYRGVLFPLNGHVAVLHVPFVGQVEGRSTPWLCADLVMTPSTVEMWNLASWQHVESGFIIGHPDDIGQLGRLDESPLSLPRLGPYRGRGVEGAYEWAYEARCLNELRPRMP